MTCKVDLCEEHAERHKDHESVLQRIKYTGCDMEDLMKRMLHLEAKVHRLEGKIMTTNECNE